jgi:hypothetical protein
MVLNLNDTEPETAMTITIAITIRMGNLNT